MATPNVLVIMTDQQQATSLGLYGNPDVRTPALERLAARGLLYRHAFSAHPLCVPSRASFWTGRWPHSTGVRTNEIPLPTREIDWATLLLDRGYVGGLFGKNHVFRMEQLDRFTAVWEAGHGGPVERGGTLVRATPLKKNAMPHGWAARDHAPRYGSQKLDESPDDSTTAQLAAQCVQFLDARADDGQPFLAWLSVPDPHEPYQAGEPYASLYDPDAIQMPPWRTDEFADKPERQQVFHELFRFADLPDRHFREVRAMYYGMIRQIDDYVGRVLDTLAARGLDENTIIMFTSDHGDYAGEHRLLGKSSTFYDALTRVPMILSWPGHLPEGETRDELVSLVDVMPTMLALLGIETPAAVQGQPMPGAVPGAAPRRAVFAEYGAGGPAVTLTDVAALTPEERSGVGWPLLRQREAQGHGKMARTARWKYVHDTTGEVDELYDLQADPWELENLAGRPDYGSALAEMRAILLDWMLETENAQPVPLYF
ncbi:MAG: sulfatase-like hydrolase/transferase [Chloroflexi bacterium]|nr:sulfatase-like hydrolase/transferase [Chloroflexota bacterium]